MGLIFIDRVRNFHLLSGYPEYKIDVSNPCLAGYTRILTDEGYKRIDSLVGTEVNIWNGSQWSKVTPRITGHDQKMLRILFSNGSHVDCTLYHKFIMEDGNRKEAKDLVVGDQLSFWKLPNDEADYTASVSSIVSIPDAPTVYCLTEPIKHSFIAEGILVGNCSEYFGVGGNSCNLGSVNLYEMVDDKFTSKAHINYDRLKYTVHYAVRMLDEVLDYGRDMQPLELNKQVIDDWRSIGLGIFGMADAFVAMGIKYGSKESRELMSDVMDEFMKQALITSIELAKLKGPFKKFDAEKTLKSIQIQAYPELHEDIKKYGIRNGSLLSIAPTGTISLFAGKYAGGIEPMFKIAYERTSHSMEDSGKTFLVYARGVEDLLKFHHCEGISVEEAKKRFPFLVESHEVPYLDRVRLQALIQEYVDNAISSTVNLPHDATVDQIKEIFIEAWKQGCKGITVFVDGCKRGNILGVEKKQDEQVTNIPEGYVPAYDSVDAPSRRNTKYVEGATVRERTSCARSMYVTVNKTEDDKVFEVFTNASGGCQSNINTITRLISLSLRSGVKLSRVIDELRNNQCPACQLLRRNGELDVSLSCSNAIADAIEMVMKKQSIGDVSKEDDPIKKTCPECGKKTLIPEGKCVTCSNCGWSKCE